MDRQKLLRIIVKDLEELKFLSEEITENEEKSNLVIDLALSKARLLCQEIEVLKEISAPAISQPEKEETTTDKTPEETTDQEEETFSVVEPELEILNFEQGDLAEGLDAGEDENDEMTSDEDKKDEETESPEAEDEWEQEEDDENEDEPEDEDDYSIEMEDETPEIDSEDDIEKTSPEVKEISLDDDEEIETIQMPVDPPVQERPVFREIPKPEEVAKEKVVVGETYQKERSVNDVIGETKSVDSKLTNGPITNLRTAIGLNDRFLFIREIFDNNADKYNNIIENLDKLETIQQAVEFLKANLTLQKNETSMKFVELLKRRFTK